MKISDLELYLVEVPATGGFSPVRSLLLRLGTDQGQEGWGETAGPWQSWQAAGMREALLPLLAGRSFYEIEELLALEPLKDRLLVAALEMACWDLVGKSARQPLCHLAGGLYRRQIPLAARLPALIPGEASQQARELAEHGFRAHIVTASGQVQDDLDVLRAVCEAVGDRVEVRFDAARRFSVDAALQVCYAAERFGLQYVLDPLQSAELEWIASLRRLTSTPLAVSVDQPGDVYSVARSGAADAVVVDPRRVGGVLAVRKCAAIAEAAGLAMLLGGPGGLGVATAAALQLAAAIPALASANDWAYHRLQDDVLCEPLELSGGMLTVPQAPGLGVEVDRGKLERITMIDD